MVVDETQSSALTAASAATSFRRRNNDEVERKGLAGVVSSESSLRNPPFAEVCVLHDCVPRISHSSFDSSSISVRLADTKLPQELCRGELPLRAVTVHSYESAVPPSDGAQRSSRHCRPLR